ncbi:hypothetical protein [Actinoallomurus rhizosphaericola]|uniref:hypothetical protein n=1 Tax=Actinoallomurus rhizosphaericola TaxID=2952536 RepID=UPI0020929567|nr:hypothetical protein [Actinoallomurus rhizosphaericola]MCO5997670.1 hypothetical protein [Actinoallomurus rhizosphaericola]
MSDQGSAGQWRPANSHSGPYSEPDEPTGPLPEVSGQDSAASGGPPANGRSGSWSSDDDAPTGGFPAVSAQEQAPNATRRERAPFEPADPGAGSADVPAGPGAPAGYDGFGAPAEYGNGAPGEYGAGPSGGYGNGAAGEYGAGSSAGPRGSSAETSGSFPAPGSFGAEPQDDPEISFQRTTAFPSVPVPEEETPSFGRGTAETFSGAAEPEFPGTTPPFESEAPNVAPYDARDAAYGYEVADPSFGYGAAHPAREADTGSDAPAVSPGPASEPYSFESLLGPADGVAGPEAPGGPQAYGDAAPPRPYGDAAQAQPYGDAAPSGPYGDAAQPQPYGDPAPTGPYGGAVPPQPYGGPGAFGGAPGGMPPAGGPVPAEDQAAENDFFSHDDDPALWNKPLGPTGPVQPGKPSSGNLRLPEWMREQEGGDGHGGLTAPPNDGFEDEGRSKRPLLAGLGVLVVGLLAAGGAYFLSSHGGSDKHAEAGSGHTKTSPTKGTSKTKTGQPAESQQEKPLPQFKGAHTKPVGRIADAHAGLSYPKLGKPWQMQTQKGAMAELGFSAGQYAVSEPKRWGRLLSAQLGGANKDAYTGPGSERAAATQVADYYEKRMYGYTHKKRVLASQSLTVGGHKGWLVGYYLTYHQSKVKTTGEIFTVAVVDTGKKAPGVVLMSVPNTAKKLWPDVDYVMHSIKVS